MELINNIKLFFKQINTDTEKAIARVLFSKSMTVSTAESCTGGLVSSRLTDIAGSSVYIKENYVTYSNEAKKKLLGVSESTLSQYGAVSEECAREMAEGLFENTDCDVALVTTGIAGPGGATEGKNVGLLFVGVKNKCSIQVRKYELDSKIGRKEMKFLFSQKALEFLLEFILDSDSKIFSQKNVEENSDAVSN